MDNNYSNIDADQLAFQRNSWAQALCASASLWLTVTFFGPLIVELTQLPVDIVSYFLTFISLTIILSLLTSFFVVRIVPLRFFSSAVVAILLLGFIIWLKAFIFPFDLSEPFRKIIPLKKYLDYHLVGAFFWLAILFIGMLFRRILFAHIKNITLVFISFQFIFTCVFYFFGSVTDQSRRYQLTDICKNSFSQNQNILLLILDNFSSHDFSEILSSDPDVAKCLDGFIFYPDCIGGYPRTGGAVPHILTGLFYDNSVPLNTFLRINLPNQSIPGILKKSLFRTEGYGFGAHILSVAPVLDNMTIDRRFFPKWSEALRVIYQFGLKCVPGISNRLHILFWSGMVGSSVYDLDRVEDLEKTAKADTVTAVFKYEHFWGVHEPYWLNKSCQIVRQPNTENSLREQATASIKLLCRYLNVLKNIGAFDNSIIFIIGDHGHSNDAPFPLMLWKPFNDSKPFRISSKPVCQADIIKTVCDELEIPLVRPEAQSFRNEDEGLPRIRRHFAYHGPSFMGYAHSYLPTLREFVSNGRKDSVFPIIPTFTVFDPGQKWFLPRLEIGAEVTFEKNSDYWRYLGTEYWQGQPTDCVERLGKSTQLFLPIRNTGKPAKISIKCRPSVPESDYTQGSIKIVDQKNQNLFKGKLSADNNIMFEVPPESFTDNLLAMQFQFLNPINPQTIKNTTYASVLAVIFESITITY